MRQLAFVAWAVVLWGGGCGLLVGVEDRSVGGVEAGVPAPTDDVRAPEPASDGALEASDASQVDSGLACDLERPFDSPRPLTSVNTIGGEFGVSLSKDELELFVTTTTRVGARPAVHRTTRTSFSAQFDPPVRVAELDVPEPHWGVSLSPDGLELMVSAGTRPRRIFRARRPSPTEPFGPSVALPIGNGPNGNAFDTPFVTGRGVLYMSQERGPQFDLFVSTMDDAGIYPPPTELAAFNTPGTSEDWPVESFDGKTLFFSSGSLASTEIVETRRTVASGPYPSGKTLVFPQAALKHPGWISVDGCRLYLVMENAPGGTGGSDIFVSTRGKP